MSIATATPPAIDPLTDKNAWLKARQETIGASEAGSVLGVPDAHESPLQVWGRKVGKIAPFAEPTEAMLMGNRLEPVIAEIYSERTSRQVLRQQIYCRHGHLSATLDGIDDAGGLVEYKTISERRASQVLGDEGTSDIPLSWILQAHQQMFVARVTGHASNTDSVHFAVLVGGQQFRQYEVPWNARLWDNAKPRLDTFWREYVQAKVAPPISCSGDAQALGKIYDQAIGTVYLDDQIAQVTDRYEDLGRQVSELNKLRDLEKARLLEAMTDHNIGILPSGRKLKRSVCVRKEYTVVATQYINLTLSRS